MDIGYIRVLNRVKVLIYELLSSSKFQKCLLMGYTLILKTTVHNESITKQHRIDQTQAVYSPVPRMLGLDPSSLRYRPLPEQCLFYC